MFSLASVDGNMVTHLYFFIPFGKKLSGQNVPQRTWSRAAVVISKVPTSVVRDRGRGTSPTPPNWRVSATKGAVNAVHLWTSLLTQQLGVSIPVTFYSFVSCCYISVNIILLHTWSQIILIHHLWVGLVSYRLLRKRNVCYIYCILRKGLGIECLTYTSCVLISKGINSFTN